MGGNKIGGVTKIEVDAFIALVGLFGWEVRPRSEGDTGRSSLLGKYGGKSFYSVVDYFKTTTPIATGKQRSRNVDNHMHGGSTERRSFSSPAFEGLRKAHFRRPEEELKAWVWKGVA